jgi:hypothetical protein
MWIVMVGVFRKRCRFASREGPRLQLGFWTSLAASEFRSNDNDTNNTDHVMRCYDLFRQSLVGTLTLLEVLCLGRGIFSLEFAFMRWRAP